MPHSPDTNFGYIEDGGIIAGRGRNWREQRRIAVGILRNFGMGKNLMEQQIMRSLDDTMRYLETVPDKSNYDMKEVVHVGIANVINEALFGYLHDRKDLRKFHFMQRVVAQFLIDIREGKWGPIVQQWPFVRFIPYLNAGYKNMKGNVKLYYEFINGEVQDVLKSYDPDRAPTNLVHAYYHEMQKKDNEFLSIEQLNCVCADFWIAGMETTTTVMRWGLMYAMDSPEVQRKIQAEIDEVVGQDRYVSMTDKPNMPYMSAFMIEVVRLVNVLSVVYHQCTRDVTVAGHLIPAGAMTMTQFGSVLWHDPVYVEPEKCKPERWLLEDGKTWNKALMERFVGFGMGKRSCAGEALARMEIFLFWSCLFQKYRFEPIGKLNFKAKYGLVLGPAEDFRCTLIPRY
ncbi:CBN-CYP-14A1 protein [Aphelenchoides avenae]|nr:CBN-CYP-14A1 protein [Aphelenchus avenae]